MAIQHRGVFFLPVAHSPLVGIGEFPAPTQAQASQIGAMVFVGDDGRFYQVLDGNGQRVIPRADAARLPFPAGTLARDVLTPSRVINASRNITAFPTTISELERYAREHPEKTTALARRDAAAREAGAILVHTEAAISTNGLLVTPRIDTYIVTDYDKARKMEGDVNTIPGVAVLGENALNAYNLGLPQVPENLRYLLEPEGVGESASRLRSVYDAPPQPTTAPTNVVPPLPAAQPKIDMRRVGYKSQLLDINGTVPSQDGHYALIVRDVNHELPPVVLTVRTPEGNFIPFVTPQPAVPAHLQPQGPSLLGWCNYQDLTKPPIAYGTPGMQVETVAAAEAMRYFSACGVEQAFRSLGAQQMTSHRDRTEWDVPATYEANAYEVLARAGIEPFDPALLNRTGADDDTLSFKKLEL